MMNMVQRLVVEEDGQGLVEYALIISLIAIVVIGALGLLGGQISGTFTRIKNSLSSSS